MIRAEQLVCDPLKEPQRERKSGFEDKVFYLLKAAFLYTCLLWAQVSCLTQRLVLGFFTWYFALGYSQLTML